MKSCLVDSSRPWGVAPRVVGLSTSSQCSVTTATSLPSGSVWRASCGISAAAPSSQAGIARTAGGERLGTIPTRFS